MDGLPANSNGNPDHHNASRIPVIIDTDPGVDDTLAILLALSSPTLDILGFVVSFGNTDLEASHTNILKIYHALTTHFHKHPESHGRYSHYFRVPSDESFTNWKKPFLSKGASGPLEGDLHSAMYFHGRDGLGNITTRHSDLRPPSNSSSEHPYLNILPDQRSSFGPNFALDTIRNLPSRSVTYIALGPLTNLAHMLRAEPDTVRDRLGRVVCMGGALDVPGNTSPMAEFNFFADPYAVHELLTPTPSALGLPLDRFVLLPLDITTPHDLPFPVYISTVDRTFHSTSRPSDPRAKLPLTHFTSAFLERAREVMLDFGKDALELHDVVAVWCAEENPPEPESSKKDGTGAENSNAQEHAMPLLSTGWEAKRRIFQIERTGEHTRGMCVVDRRDEALSYAPGVVREEVSKLQELGNGVVIPSMEPREDKGDNLSAASGAVASLPVPTQVSSATELPHHHTGVACVVRTPGPEVLLSLMMRRIWGVEY